MTCLSILVCLTAMLSLLQSGLATPHVARQSTSAQDVQAYLSAHNTVRARHGAVALAWSDLLASKAQQWAAPCNFVHSGGTLGRYGGKVCNSWLKSLAYDCHRKPGCWHW